jgi:hypothetical protein
VRIHLAAEHAPQLELAHAVLEFGGLALQIAEGTGIVLRLGEFEELGRVAERGQCAVEAADVLREPRTRLAQGLRAVRIVPDVRQLQLAGYFLEPLLLAVVVKETP